MLIIFISIWASLQALLGMYMLSNKNRWGFVVSLTNQIPWIILATLAGTYGTYLLSTAMVWVTVRGWLRWSN